MSRTLHPQLRNNSVDRTQAVLRSLTSAIDSLAPGIGSVFGELLSVVLPANREERLAQFASDLDREVRRVRQSLESIVSRIDSEQLALLEDGMRHSVRASQRARISKIAYVVAEGLVEDQSAVRQREVLEMLARLSDCDLITLSRFINRDGTDSFREPAISVGAWNAMSEEDRQATLEGRRLRELSWSKLQSIGLLDHGYNAASQGYGSDRVVVEASELKITALGQFLAQQLGLWPEGLSGPGSG